MLAGLLILAATGALADDDHSHADEIRIFATTMAIARTVKESCPGIAPDDHFLDAFRRSLHVVDADLPTFEPAARAAAEALQKAVEEAPSQQAWCEATYRLYGPGGKLMRGMLLRPQDR